MASVVQHRISVRSTVRVLVSHRISCALRVASVSLAFVICWASTVVRRIRSPQVCRVPRARPECLKNRTCDGAGSCAGGFIPDCSVGLPSLQCHTHACLPDIGCIYPPLPDGTPCVHTNDTGASLLPLGAMRRWYVSPGVEWPGARLYTHRSLVSTGDATR